jgi:CPA2 family monovalent cation:H+ antiporter-2
MQITFMTDILIIFGLSITVIYLFHRIRVSSIIGFIATGLLAGPHGLGLISSVENVKILSEFGIIALLFTIGLEFSFRHLFQIRKSVLMGGSLQVGLTMLIGALIAIHAGYPLGQALFFGCLLSLSSTAIVLKLLQDRGELDSPHGRSALGILLFQDLIVIPMILFLPFLAGNKINMASDALPVLVKGSTAVVLVFVMAKWLVPYLLYSAARTRSRQLFLLVVLIIGLSVAWLTYSAGLSLALGAFLAGLIISESEYNHEAIGHMLPFRDVFISFFFVSIGMLINLEYFFSTPFIVLTIMTGVLILKSALSGSAILLQGFPLRISILAGVAISQIGEFSFVLANMGESYGLMEGNIYQLFLTVSVFTMILTPFTIHMAPQVTKTLLHLPLPKKIKAGGALFHELRRSEKSGHLIIVGFGLNGHNVARAARRAGISYVVLETNPDTVRAEKAKGEEIYYGDATHEAVLQHAGIKTARAFVVVINDPTATRRIVGMARHLNPKLYIIVRTRFLREMDGLKKLGADEVIPEEFETSVEIFSRVLRKYLIPRPEIEKFVAEVRADGYEMFRSLSKEAGTCTDMDVCLPDAEIATFRLDPDAPAAGEKIADIALRKKHGITLLAVRRGEEMLYNPDAETRLLGGDILVLFGSPEKMIEAAPLFRPSETIDSSKNRQ